MIKVGPGTQEAIEAGRLRFFVFFDFMFEPTRVHCGDEQIEWNGYDWTGVGGVLRTNFSCSMTSFSSTIRMHGTGGYNRGHIKASLPLDDTNREVITKGYYRNRNMELFICSFDEYGKIIEQVVYADGSIVNVSLEDNIVTFTAEDTTLDSIEEKDLRHRTTVEAHRSQFSEELYLETLTKGPNMLMNLVAAIMDVNQMRFLLDVLTTFLDRNNKRTLKQRWQARKRQYWFTTTPRIPYKWERKKGYPIGADTLAEAKCKFYKKVTHKIWLIPRGWIKMIISVDGKPLELLDLDQIRQTVDPERFKATDPFDHWGRDE